MLVAATLTCVLATAPPAGDASRPPPAGETSPERGGAGVPGRDASARALQFHGVVTPIELTMSGFLPPVPVRAGVRVQGRYSVLLGVNVLHGTFSPIPAPDSISHYYTLLLVPTIRFGLPEAGQARVIPYLQADFGAAFGQTRRLSPFEPSFLVAGAVLGLELAVVEWVGVAVEAGLRWAQRQAVGTWSIEDGLRFAASASLNLHL